MNVIEKAIGFAVKAHAGALRKGTNLPYILHPLEAASIAAQMTDDQEIIAATVLHDTVEDTETSAEDIRKEFGARVASLVSSNTENPQINIDNTAPQFADYVFTTDSTATIKAGRQISLYQDTYGPAGRMLCRLSAAWTGCFPSPARTGQSRRWRTAARRPTRPARR